MSCLLEPWTCDPVGTIVGGAVDKGVKAFADAIAGGVGDTIKALMTWWVTGNNVFANNTTPIENMQHLLLPVTLIVATAALVWQGIMMVVTRKADPLIDATRGILALAFYSGVGVTALVLAMKAADALSVTLVNGPTEGQFGQRMIDLFKFADVSPGLTIGLGFLIMFATVVQWVLLFFRQASLVVLAVFMPIAAAGSITQGTRPWLRRLLSWMLSLIAYKPMVAACYAIAFEFIGNSKDLDGIIIGFMVLVLSIVALPAMLRFFSWGIDATAEHMGTGFGRAAAAGLGLASAGMQVANGLGGSGRVTAQEQASVIEDGLGPVENMPSSGGGGAGGGGGDTSAPSGSSPAPDGAAAGGSAMGAGASNVGAAGPAAAGAAAATHAASAAASSAGDAMTADAPDGAPTHPTSDPESGS